MIRRDDMPQNASEICACISLLAIAGQWTEGDSDHVLGWLCWRLAHGMDRTPAALP